jgi:hypothetical protein
MFLEHKRAMGGWRCGYLVPQIPDASHKSRTIRHESRTKEPQIPDPKPRIPDDSWHKSLILKEILKDESLESLKIIKRS